MTDWTTQEVQTLKELAPTVPPPIIAKRLGRSRGAIHAAAKRLGIDFPVKGKGRRWPKAMEEEARELRRQGLRICDIEQHFDASRSCIVRWVRGIPFPPEGDHA